MKWEWGIGPNRRTAAVKSTARIGVRCEGGGSILQGEVQSMSGGGLDEREEKVVGKLYVNPWRERWGPCDQEGAWKLLCWRRRECCRRMNSHSADLASTGGPEGDPSGQGAREESVGGGKSEVWVDMRLFKSS